MKENLIVLLKQLYMRVYKIASGATRVTLSRTEWEHIGRIASWLVVAGLPPGLYSISVKDLMKNLREIGCTCVEQDAGNHYIVTHPSAVGQNIKVSTNKDKWTNGFHKPSIWRDFKNRLSPDIGFVFQTPLRIPNGFNISTLRIEKPKPIPAPIPVKPSDIKTQRIDALIAKYYDVNHSTFKRDILIDVNGEFKAPVDIAYVSDSDSWEFIFKDESIEPYKASDKVTYKEVSNTAA